MIGIQFCKTNLKKKKKKLFSFQPLSRYGHYKRLNLLNFGKGGQMVYFMRMYFRIFISFQRFSQQKDGIRFDSKQKLGAGSEVRFDNMDPYNTIFGSGSVYLIDVGHFQSR